MTYVGNGGARQDMLMDTEWRAGEYLRLSKEDGDKPESDSIQNQQKIVEDHIRFLQGQGERIVSAAVYPDDGYAGGSFDRPHYRRMIEDIEAGRINCVIFKDNSRLGRNYPELGRLMEDYFPQKGVRVISVLNNLDSVRDPRGYGSAIVSFSNIVNDDYIRQLSLKIKCTLDMKRQRGEYIGNYAPYGYVKSPGDRHRLEVDPEAAQVVRTVFAWYAGGLSAAGVAKRLNALRIPPPSVYKTANGCRGFARPGNGTWSLTTVNAMLRDEVYIGNLIQGKRKSVSYRTKKTVLTDESQWTVIQGAHEPVVSDSLFAAVHDRLARHARAAPRGDAVYLLSGYVFCGCCGRRMTRCVSRGVARYRCPTRICAPERCQCPSVKETDLESAVLEAVREQISRVDASAALEAALRSAPPPAEDRRSTALRQTRREIARLEEALFRLYDDRQQGVVDQSDYQRFRMRYQEELARQQSQCALLQAALAEQDGTRQSSAFLSYFQTHGNIPALDPEVMGHLIDKVIFHAPGRLDVCFKFQSPASPACSSPSFL